MAKRVQNLRHPSVQSQQFVGYQGELTVDTGVWALRVHDGSTAGGHLLLNKSAADTFYQGKSDALSSLAALGDNDTGLLVKRAGSFAPVSIVAGDNVTVTNGNGQSGDTITVAVAGLGTAAYVDTGTADANVPTWAQLKASALPIFWPIGMAGLWRKPLADLPTGFEVVAAAANRVLVAANAYDEVAGNPTTEITGSAAQTGGATSFNIGAGLSTSTAGAHAHGSSTGGTALSVAQMPSHWHYVASTAYAEGVLSSGNYLNMANNIGARADHEEYVLQGGGSYPSAGLSSATGSGQAHYHTISSDGGHTHVISGSITIIPSFVAAGYLVERTS